MFQASRVRLAVCVLLPFAAGYYLSYLFRCINALIAGDLVAELGLGAADLGLLTSVYFLVFAAVQLPCGVLLDRYGPRVVDSALLLIAAAGALLFALADGVAALLVARALIGLGVAVGLMAGLKAIVLWFPPERVALANGSFRASAGAACSPASLWLPRAWRCSFFSSCRRGTRRRAPLPHRGSASSPSTSIHVSCA
jgi:sugar phosphate permease